jgi:hypothetical protein
MLDLVTAATWITLGNADKNWMWALYTRDQRREMMRRLRALRLS